MAQHIMSLRSHGDRAIFLDKPKDPEHAGLPRHYLLLVRFICNSLTSLRETFHGSRASMESAFSARRAAHIVRSEAFATMDKLGNHFASSVAQRNDRLELSGRLDPLFRIQGLRRPSQVNTYEERLHITAQMISGDAVAVEMGHPAMANPSAEELKTARDAAQAALDAATEADRLYQEAQEAFWEICERTDGFHRVLIASLRTALADREPATQRRIMRMFGITFKTEPGSEEEPSGEPTTETPGGEPTTEEPAGGEPPTGETPGGGPGTPPSGEDPGNDPIPSSGNPAGLPTPTFNPFTEVGFTTPNGEAAHN